jgi:hypothetical protein
MDILNWLYLKSQQLVKKTANNANTDLIAIGANVGFTKRDDQYQTYAMSLKDLSTAGCVANTAYYTLDYGVNGPTIDVTTTKGVIEITNFAADVPDPAFASATPLIIQNSDITFGNADNIYLQLSVYYRPALDDTFIPYILATGAILGQEIAIFNANPAVAGADQGEGLLYVYYELYQF